MSYFLGRRGYQPPRIYILPRAKKLLDSYIRNCKWEISGFGIVKRIGRDFLIVDVKIVKQEVNGGHASMDMDAVHEVMIELATMDEGAGELKMQWHSHVDGGVHPSWRDEENNEGYGHDWMIFVVGNKCGEYSVSLELSEPTYLVFNNLGLTIYEEVDPEIEKFVQAEVASKVKYVKPKRATKGDYLAMLAGSSGYRKDGD